MGSSPIGPSVGLAVNLGNGRCSEVRGAVVGRSALGRGGAWRGYARAVERPNEFGISRV